MPLHARFTNLSCLLCFILSLTFKSEKMYFESALYFIGLGIKFIENAYFIIGCY